MVVVCLVAGVGRYPCAPVGPTSPFIDILFLAALTLAILDAYGRGADTETP